MGFVGLGASSWVSEGLQGNCRPDLDKTRAENNSLDCNLICPKIKSIHINSKSILYLTLLLQFLLIIDLGAATCNFEPEQT